MRYTAEWLTAHGFDGLYDTCPDNDECGCPADNLRPCDKEWRTGRKCRPGVRIEVSLNIFIIGPKEN
jgi:hypothetical protein